MAKKKVFVSYDHSEDATYKYLLQAWDANDNFDFEFDNRSVNVAIDSDDADVIKRSLTTKMKQADYLLVIVGKKTSSSKWVNWEVSRAMQDDVKLKLSAVKIDSGNSLPKGMTSSNTAIADGFEEAKIISALNKATNNY
jgi:hypothetical protein